MVRVQRVAHVVDLHEEILLFWFRFCGGFVVGFGRGLRRLNALALAAHVPKSGLFGLGEIIVYVLNVHTRPGKEISVSNGFEPGCFGQKTGRGVEIADGGFNTRELVDVVDGFAGGGPGAHGLDVVAHRGDVWHAVEGVERAAAVQRVQEEGVGVSILDVGGEGGAPQLSFGAPPPLENSGLANLNFGGAAVVYVDLLAVVD